MSDCDIYKYIYATTEEEFSFLLKQQGSSHCLPWLVKVCYQHALLILLYESMAWGGGAGAFLHSVSLCLRTLASSHRPQT